MSRFISYVVVFVLGFIACAVAFEIVDRSRGGGMVTMAPVLPRGGVGIDKQGSNVIRNAAGIASEYVVNIDTVGKPVRESGFPDFFGFPFGGEQPEEVIPRGQASGVIYTSDGYIITNNHVVEDAQKLTVTTHGGKKFPAKLIGRDPRSDLAVIKIDAGGLPYARFAPNPVQVGDWVIAVGNALGLGPTVTVGVVSAKRSVDIDGKMLEGLIQTDAAINRGNSGGALADANGNLIGINTAILSTSPGGGNIGIGFAIPSSTVKTVVDQLVKSGKVVRPYMGIVYGSYNDDQRTKLMRDGIKNLPRQDGALIGKVMTGSPADQAGLQPGDIILKINGKPISATMQTEDGKVSISSEVGKAKIGDRIILEVWQASDGQIANVGVRVAQAPESMDQQP